MLAGLAYSRGWIKSRVAAAAMLCVGVTVFVLELPVVVPLEQRCLFWGVPAFLIVLGATSLERLRLTWTVGFLLLLGDASYSIYLSHIFCNLGFDFALKHIPPARLPSLDVIIIFATAMFLIPGLLTYWYIEQPIIAFFRQRRSARVPSVRNVNAHSMPSHTVAAV
jgi:exopolysaccharide production protein ExoZ